MTAASYPNGIQERRAAVMELRAVGRRLEGLACPFNSPAQIGTFEERVSPGSFTATLRAGQDTLALLDHDPTRLLARTSNGTLRLAESPAGLTFSLDVPNTTLGHDALAMAEAGLFGGVSIAFRVAPNGEKWLTPSTRLLTAVDLVEVSLIQAFPAYQTTVSARARALGYRDASNRIQRMRLLEL